MFGKERFVRKLLFIKDFYYSISIKIKLMLIILILMICSIVFMGYLGYKSYADVFRNKSLGDLKKNVDEYTTIISERLDNIISLSEKIIMDNNLYELNDDYSNYLKNNNLSAESSLKTNINLYLRSYLLTGQEFDFIAFRFNANNKVYCVPSDPQMNVENIKLNFIFDSSKKGNGAPVWHLDHQNGKLKGIYLEKPVIGRSSNNEIGSIVLKIRDDYLFGIIDSYLSHKVQNVRILSDNIRLYYYNSIDIGFEDEASSILKGSEPGQIRSLNYKSDKIYLFYNNISPLNWKLSVYISSNTLLVDLKKVLFMIVILCVLTLPIWLLLIKFIYRDIIKPVNILVESMGRIEKGETGITVDARRNDELGYVFKTFNKMSQEINNLINKVYREELAMKDAEIKALQAQINPHFLYNTLETINWKAQLCGANDISEMVTALSSIIDANLDRNDEKMIPVKKEIEYIDNYNLLIQRRFGKKITFVKSIDDGALDYMIPKLLIQPLIENAIYHGLETKKGGGTVELLISIEEDMVLIVVADNGIGIDDETLKALKESLYKNVENQYESRTKIGIMNVHRRIKLIYGEEYGLNIFSESNKGTTIILKLPFIENRGA